MISARTPLDALTAERLRAAEAKARAAINAALWNDAARELKRDNDAHERMRRRVASAYSGVTVTEGVPVEATEPDMALSDCMKALDYYRAGLEKRTPNWVPCRVLLKGPVRGDYPIDYPIGHPTLAEAGEHDCESNRYGAISVRATNGQMMGVKPSEFDPLKWRKNERDNDAHERMRRRLV